MDEIVSVSGFHWKASKHFPQCWRIIFETPNTLWIRKTIGHSPYIIIVSSLPGFLRVTVMKTELYWPQVHHISTEAWVYEFKLHYTEIQVAVQLWAAPAIGTEYLDINCLLVRTLPCTYSWCKWVAAMCFICLCNDFVWLCRPFCKSIVSLQQWWVEFFCYLIYATL